MKLSRATQIGKELFFSLSSQYPAKKKSHKQLNSIQSDTKNHIIHSSILKANKTKNSKDKAQSDLDLYKQEKKKQDEIKIAQAIGDATKKIAKESFDFKIKQIEIEKENLQGLYDFEMKLAGNNATAKQRIEIETHQKMLSLKRQEA